jgi:thiamine pyrophosphokinase
MGKISAQKVRAPQRDECELREAWPQVQSPIFDAKSFPDLVFNGVLVVVGGGTVDGVLLRQLKEQGASIIAADGGAAACAHAGVMPEAIIGDMDSVTSVTSWAGKTQFIEILDQETTDFEKCLYCTTAPLTLALGMTGKRFDHTMAALNAVARYGAERAIILVDEEDIALSLAGEFTFAVDAGERVSVHPLHEISFAGSIGLKYPLDGLTLAPAGRTGTSNEAIDGPFTIMPDDDQVGTWLLIVSRHYLSDLIDVFLERK